MDIRLTEQILLLILNETSGKIYPLPNQHLDYAIAGGLLIELAFEERVRCHQGIIKTLQGPPTGNAILDLAMQYLPKEGASESATKVLEELTLNSNQFTNAILESLVEKGVLEQGTYRYSWFFAAKPEADKATLTATAIKGRIREILFHNATPTEKEAALLGIAASCNLMTHLFSPEHIRAAEPRLKKLVRFEIINHVVANALDGFLEAMAKNLNTLNITPLTRV